MLHEKNGVLQVSSYLDNWMDESVALGKTHIPCFIIKSIIISDPLAVVISRINKFKALQSASKNEEQDVVLT